MTTIKLAGLTKAYGSRTVIDRLDLTVESGELLTLLGPSGSGKSTILKLIAGIETVDAGDICFDDRSIVAVPAHQRGAVLMFQAAYLFPFLTVAENIAFGLKVQRRSKVEIKAEVQRLLDLVELPGIERRYPRQLSGGQQQRVALARALAPRPRVLMLDEPLSNLDTAIRQTLQVMIRRIQREFNITTVLVTHDLSEAMAMSDRTAVLLDGQIVACDTPQRIYERPPSRAAAQFVGVTLLLDGQLCVDGFDSALGRLPLHSTGTARRTTFAIRPEQVRLHTTPCEHGLAGIVTEQVYRGDWTEYVVQVRGIEVRAKVYGTAVALAVGDSVYVEFPPSAMFEVI